MTNGFYAPSVFASRRQNRPQPRRTVTSVADFWWMRTRSGKSRLRNQHNMFSLVWSACKTEVGTNAPVPNRRGSKDSVKSDAVSGTRPQRPLLVITLSTPMARPRRKATVPLSASPFSRAMRGLWLVEVPKATVHLTNAQSFCFFFCETGHAPLQGTWNLTTQGIRNLCCLL